MVEVYICSFLFVAEVLFIVFLAGYEVLLRIGVAGAI